MTALPRPPAQLRLVFAPRPVRLSPGSRAAVRAYARLNPWLDPRDLEQEAAVVALEAASTWRNGGTSPDLWEAWKVGLALSQVVAAQLAPVTMPKKKGGAVARAWSTRGPANPREVALDDPDYDGHATTLVNEFAGATATWEPIEDRIDLERAAAEVRRILAEETEAARAVLLAEEKSHDVAARLGVPVKRVYQETASAMRRLRAAFAGWEAAT